MKISELFTAIRRMYKKGIYIKDFSKIYPLYDTYDSLAVESYIQLDDIAIDTLRLHFAEKLDVIKQGDGIIIRDSTLLSKKHTLDDFEYVWIDNNEKELIENIISKTSTYEQIADKLWIGVSSDKMKSLFDNSTYATIQLRYGDTVTVADNTIPKLLIKSGVSFYIAENIVSDGEANQITNIFAIKISCKYYDVIVHIRYITGLQDFSSPHTIVNLYE